MFLSFMARADVIASAKVRHGINMNGTVEGSVQQMTGESVTLNGGAVITNDLLVPGSPTVRLNGHPSFGGTIVGTGSATPTGYTITLNGNSTLDKLRTRTNAITLPTVPVPPSPSGTRNVTINSAGQNPGPWNTLKNLTLNSNVGPVAVPAGTYGDFAANGGSTLQLGVAGTTSTYNLQHLTLNGQAVIEVLGPVVLNVRYGFNLNGHSGFGSHPDWLTININGGDMNINGGATLYGFLTAPNSRVIINGQALLEGGLTSDYLTVNGGGVLRLRSSGGSGNQPPVANGDGFITNEDQSQPITLTGRDPEGQPITFSVVTPPTKGTLLGSGANLTYKPNDNVNGTDSFTFKVNDGALDSAVATISITITPVNDGPKADPQFKQATEDTPLPLTLTGSDVDGNSLTFTLLTFPSATEGTVSQPVAGSPNVVFTPAPDYSTAPDQFVTFTFKVNDGFVDSVPATVRVAVGAVNDAPVASADPLTMLEDTFLGLTLTARDVDGDALTYTIITQPQHGALIHGADSSRWTYQPDANFFGDDSFTFRANDGHVNSNTATVNITVMPVNDPPTATPHDTVVTNEDVDQPFTLAGHDEENDPLTFAIVTQPSKGVLIPGIDSAHWTYRPNANENGPDNFAFRANDGQLDSTPVTVQVQINPVNDKPVAQDGSVTTAEDTAVNLVLGGSDQENSPLTFTIVSGPEHGGLSGSGSNRTYTPNANFNQTDTFTFQVSDGGLVSDVATFTIAVVPRNDKPVASAQSLETDEDTSLPITLTASDADGDALTFTVLAVSPANSGTAVQAAPGSPEVVFTPAPDFFTAPDQDPVTLTFKANDGRCDSVPATIAIRIQPINDAPVTVLTAPAEGAVYNIGAAVPVTATASDIDGTVTRVEFYVDDQLIGTDTEAPFTATWTAAQPGVHIFVARAFDDSTPAGVGESAAVSVIVNAPPTVALTLPGNGASFVEGTPINFAATASDSDGTVLKVEYYDSTTKIGESTTAPYVAVWNDATVGPHVLTAVAFDDEGAAGTSQIIHVTVTPANRQPMVNAGTDATVAISSPLNLAGTVSDDGLPADGVLTVTWSKVSGPGAVGFADEHAAATEFRAAAIGTYVLRLSATDGQLSASDEVTVTVIPGNLAPTVDAGANQSLPAPGPAFLDGTATDDGLPTGSTLHYAWKRLSGPGAVNFTTPQALSTGAVFTTPGTYVVRLTVSDGALAASDELTVTVAQPNAAPQVDAGPDTTGVVGATTMLAGAVNDDGQPAGEGLSIHWSKISGPGNVSFANEGEVSTGVTFSAAGTYVLRLEASDSALSSHDEVAVTVAPPPNAAPQVNAGADQTIAVVSTLLQGVVTDDGLPAGSTLTQQWTQVSGPSAAVFDTPAALTTAVHFSSPGAYVLRLTASDSAASASDEVAITVTFTNQPPVVNAGADQTASFEDGAALRGSVTDDGLPMGSVVTVHWSKVSGPGTVTLANAANAATAAQFSAPGNYVLRLTASDSVLSALDDVAINVVATSPNAAPVVDAGPDQATSMLPKPPPAGPVTPVKLTALSANFNQPIGVDYHEPSGKVLISTNYPSGQPYNFALIEPDGTRSRFSPISGLTEELKLATAKNAGGGYSLGGFEAGETFTGTGVPGQIIRISPDGSHAQNPWITLPGEGGLMRGSLQVDSTGIFGGDLVVVTTAGSVWRINHEGVPTRLASIPTHLEGLCVIPNDPRYGPWAGKMLIGAEGQGRLYTVDPAGTVEFYAIGINPEDIDLINANQNFYGVDTDEGIVWGAPASAFTNMIGDILITQESPGILYDVRWDGAQFVKTQIAQTRHFEHVTFAPSGILDIPQTEHPIELTGTATDDGLPAGSTLQVTWEQVSGPFPVSIDFPHRLNTAVKITEPGIYVFRLTGDDSEKTASDTTTITALPPNTAPLVSAGPDLGVGRVGDVAALHGWASDDGLPLNVPVTTTWSVVAGPGTVNFADATAADTTATFSAPGIYLLKLTASDSLRESSDLAEVRVAIPCFLEAPQGIVAWWPGNGHSLDLIGGHDGTLYGGTDYGAGKVSLGFHFDGVDDYFRVPAASELNVGAGSGLTVEFWIKPNDPNRWQPLLEWNGGGLDARGAHIYIEGYFQGGRLWVNLIDSAGGEHPFLTNPGLLGAGELTHIAVTYEKASGWMRIYRNGGLFQEGRIGTFTPRTTSGIYVGHIPGDGFFNGVLDEISIYNRALTSEITQIYAAGLVGKCPPSDNEPPVVDAGPNRTVAAVNAPVTLQGLVSDDSLPVGAPVTSQWSVLSGPGGVAFADAQSPVTSATFDAPGIYLLQLTANDTRELASDTVEVRVALPCAVEAPQGLVAWWQANGNTRDAVSGQDGLLLHGTTFGPGESSLAFSFDGIDDGIRVPHTAALDVGSGNAFTVEFWLNPTDPNHWRPIIEWNNGINYGAHIWIEGYFQGGRLWVNLFDKAGAAHEFTSAPNLVRASEWQHLAVSYDRVSGFLRVWRNGGLFQEVFLGRFTPQTGPGYDLYMGLRPADGSRLAGLLDEVSIYNRALDTELTDIYRAGAVGKCPLEANEAPVVSAGPDQTAHAVGDTVSLAGAVSDDGLPSGSVLSARWSLVDGPGSVNFADETAPATTASFSAPGIYLLRLTADDSSHSDSDTVEVRVGVPCTAEPPAGIVAWWSANGDTRDVIAGNDGTLLSGTSFASAKVSQGWNFDGIDDNIRIPAAPELDLGAGSGFTVEFWLNPANPNAWQPLVEWNGGAPGPVGMHIWVEGYFQGGRLWVNLLDTAGVEHPCLSNPGFLVAGQFQHVAVTYDKPTGVVRFYRNGALFQQFVVGTFRPQTTYDLYISNRPGDPARFRGVIDELTFYNRPLDTELFDIATADSTGKCPLSGNTAPFVDAGPDQEAGSVSDSVPLAGWVSDDGLPAGSAVAIQWSLVRGPGTPTFADPASAATTATFSAPGIYLLKLAADDSESSADDLVEVRVAPACQEPPTGLVGWWPGNHDARDLTGGHDGVLLSGVNFSQGEVGEAFQFDGVNDSIRVAGSSDLNVGAGAGFTVEFWLNPTDANRWQPLVVWHGGYPSGLMGAHLWIEGYFQGGRLWANFIDSNGGDHGFPTAPGLIVANQWQHIAVSYDKATGLLRFYRNGALFQEVSYGSFTPRTNTDLYFGHHPGDPSLFAGKLDEISIYNQALSAANIATVAAAGAAGKCPPARPNQAPYVFAGLDRRTALSDTLNLDGIVHDDGEPTGSTLTVQWSQVSGPAPASFDSAASAATTAHFSALGLYVLRLTATDGTLSAQSDVSITVTSGATNVAPTVDAGGNQSIRLPAFATLAGSAGDDGLLTPFTVRWRKITGPGTVTFADSHSAATTAEFSAAGIYALRLTANDGEFTTSSDINVTVLPSLAANQPPVVNAGPDSPAFLDAVNTLHGAVNDDGLPLGSTITVHWELVSGPGTATFGQVDQLDTTVQFSAPGAYLLRLTASDSDATGTDQVVLSAYPVLNHPPVVDAGADQQVSISDGALLQPTITDDGLPAGSNVVVNWKKISGPGPVFFTREGSATRARFNYTGTYVLEVTADDSDQRGSDRLTVTVGSAQNRPPYANAGPDRTIAYGETVSITPEIDDDWLPDGYVSVSWQVVSGPGNVHLNRAEDTVSGTFGKVGAYVLRLFVSDGEYTSTDDVAVIVSGGSNAAPVVALTAPAAGASVSLGEAATLFANASDPENHLAGVEFYVDGQLLDSDSDAPFSASWIPATVGSHVLTAVAVDEIGQQTVSAAVNVTAVVGPPVVRLTAPVDGAGFTPGTSISLAASASSVAGVTRVDFLADGVALGSDSTAPYGALWSTAVEGPHTLTATATAGDGQTRTTSLTVYVMNPPDDLPLVEIATPADGDSITAPTPLVGTVDSTALRKWTLEYRRLGDECGVWVVFASGTAVVENDALATLDPTLLLNGIYEIRLRAFDRFGGATETVTTVSVDGDMKVGEFTFTSSDVTIDLPGLSLDVRRTYRTAKRCADDFGPGWSLDVAAVKLVKTSTMGDGWLYDVFIPENFLIPPTYTLQDGGPHLISVVFPTGETYRFKPVLTLKRRPTFPKFDKYGHVIGQDYAPIYYEDKLAIVYQPLRDAEGMQLIPHGYRTVDPWYGTAATLTPDADLFVGDPYTGALRLCSRENSTQDAPEVIDATGFDLIMPDGRIFTFDEAGELTKMSDRAGHTIEVRDDGIYHSSGLSVTWQRDPANHRRITQIFDPAGQSFHYDYSPSGDLAKVTDRSGNATQFAYDVSGKLKQILDPRGQAILNNIYGVDGRLLSTTDAAGNITTFDHDLNGRIETISLGGRTSTVKYNDLGQVIERIDSSGVRRSFSYATSRDGTPTSRRASETVWARLPSADGSTLNPPVPVTTQYFYDDDDPATVPKDDGLLRKVIDPDGQVIRLGYSNDLVPEAGRAVVPNEITSMVDARENAAAQAAGRPPQASASFSYYDVPQIGGDANPLFGLQRSMTDAYGRTATLTYHGNTAERGSLGQLKSIDRLVTSFDGAGNPVSQVSHTGFEYDSHGFVNEVTTPTGVTVQMTHDILGRLLREQFDRSVYDGNGAVSGVESLITARAYDASGHLTRTWRPDRPRTSATETWTDGDNQGPSSETVYNQLGKPRTTYDAAGQATQYEYDVKGQLTKVTYPGGCYEETLYDASGRKEYVRSREATWTRFYYDGAGRQTRTAFLGSTRVTTPGAGVTVQEIAYDDLGHVWKKTDGGGHTAAFVWSKSGRPQRQINAKGEATAFGWDENGNLTAIIDPLDPSRTISNEYDLLNRRVNTVYPVSDVTINGSLQSVATEQRVEFDELGRRVADYEISPVGTPLSNRPGRHYQYSLGNSLTAVRDALGHATNWNYDEAGNRVSQTDAAGHTTHYTYDALGRRTGKVLPGGQAESRGYDAAGRLESLTMTNGQTMTNGYDAAGRLIQRVTTANGVTEGSTYDYDPVTGLRTSATDSTGTTTYTYDERGRLTEKHTPLGGAGGTTLFYDWTGADKVATIHSSTPNGVNLTYQYDALNRVEKVLSGLSEVMAYTYDRYGSVTGAAAGSGMSQTFGFDAMNRLRSVAVNSPAPVTGAPTPIASFDYTLNSAGQRTSVTELGGRTTTYDYDALRRLTGETVSGNLPNDSVPGLNGSVAYSYDDVGNRLSRTVSGALASTLPSVPEYHYNANDDPTNTSDIPATDPTTVENVQGRMILDADGNLVRKIVSTVTTDYLIAEHNPTGYSQVVEEFTNGSLSCVYDLGLKQIDQRRRLDDGSGFATHYYVHDGAGSVRALTDATGAPTDAYDYDAFGNNIGQWVYDAAQPAVRNEYRFAGERYDEQARLYHLRARFFDPALGRMVGEDPFEGYLRQPASLHRFVYAQNDPVNLSDPSGAFPTLASMMMRVMGADPITTAQYESTTAAQHSALESNKALVRTVGAYLRKLQQRYAEDSAADDDDSADNAGEFGVDGSSVWSNSANDLDQLVPVNLREIALRDAQHGLIGSGLFNAIDLVMNLTEGHGATIGQILGALNDSSLTFGAHFDRAFPGQYYSAGVTHTASNPGLNMRVTEFYSPPSQGSEKLDVIDTIPPRFMRVALNGRPVPDAPPTMDAETDHKPVETYVHAGNLHLRHEVLDINVPLPGGELFLGVRRSFESQNWTEQSQVYPERLPDQPFGPGWSSNLSACIRFQQRLTPPSPGVEKTMPDGSKEIVGGDPLWGNYAFVRDLTGAETRFVILYQNGEEAFLPMPTSQQDIDVGQLKLESIGGGVYVFTSKFGTKLTFRRMRDANGSELITYRLTHERWNYARLVEAEDRFGTRLVHEYDTTDTMLPARIRGFVGASSRTIEIAYNADRRVESVTDPRGSIYHYGYTALNYVTRYEERTLPVLTSLVAPQAEAGNGDQAETRYGYDIDDQETRWTTSTYGFDPDVNTYFHLDLTGIRDPQENNHYFNYTYDHSYLVYWDAYKDKAQRGPGQLPGGVAQLPQGYYPEKGHPRIIASVVFPPLATGGSPVVSRFYNYSRVYSDIARQRWLGTADNGRRNASRAATRRLTVIQDTEGHQRIYDFDQFQYVPMATVEPKMMPDPVPDLTNVRVYVPHIYEHTRARVIHLDRSSQIFIDLSAKRPSYSVPQTLGQEVFEYDPDAGLEISKITDLSGNTVEFEYADSWVYPVSTALNVNYPFQKHGDPTRRTRSGTGLTQALVRQFGYANAPRVLNRLIDEEGRETVYEINDRGQTTAQEVHAQVGGGDIQRTEFFYHGGLPSFLVRQEVTRGTGDAAWAVALSTTYTPDSVTGLVASQTTDATGLALTTSMTYDANGNRTSVTDPRGALTSFAYDNLNQLVQIEFAQTDPAQPANRHDFFYDLNGNKIREQDENGTITDYEYDTWNRLTKTTRRMQVGNDIETSVAYNLVDSVVLEVDARGAQTAHSYDGLQRLTETIAPLNTRTQFFYETSRNTGASGMRPASFHPTRIVDPRGVETRITYDAAYRKIREERDIATGAAVGQIDYRYDGAGNVRFTDVHRGAGVLTSETQFDALNRPVKQIHPDGKFSTVEYTATGLPWRATDERGFATETEYDGAGRPTVVRDASVAIGGGGSGRPTSYTYYDQNGNVVAQSRPHNGTVGYGAMAATDLWVTSYDARNRKRFASEPRVWNAATSQWVTPTVETQYDGVGNVVASIDADGKRSDIVYDRAYRVVQKAGPAVGVLDANGSPQVVRPTTLTSYDPNGNVVSVTDPNGSQTINTYDALNRLTASQDAQGIIVGFGYDAVGNRTRVTDGNHHDTTFTFDGLNRVTSETDHTSHATVFEYNQVNRIARTDAIGRRTTYDYDLRNRLIGESYAGRSQDDRSYTYDDSDNLLSVDEAGTERDVGYTYDAAARLSSETCQGLTHQYGYDLAGNMTHVVYGGTGRTVVHGYDSADRLTGLTESGRTTTYGYDVRGQEVLETLPNGDSVSITHDAIGRETSRLGRNASSSELYRYTMSYDATGNVRRVAESYAPQPGLDRTVTNSYDAINRLRYEVVTGASAATTEYRYDDANNRTARIVAGGPKSGSVQYGYNELNQLVSETGARTATYSYDFDGNRISQTVNAGAGAETTLYGYDYENRLIGWQGVVAGQQATLSYRYDYRTRRVTRTENALTTSVVFSGGQSVQEYEAGAGPNPVVEYVRGSDMGGGVGGMLYTLRASGPSYTHANARGDVTTKTNSAGAVTWQATYEAFGTRTAETGNTADRQRANSKDEDPSGLLNEGMRYRDLETGTFLTRDPAGFVDGPNRYAYVVQNPWTSFDPDGLASSELEKSLNTVQHLFEGVYEGGIENPSRLGSMILKDPGAMAKSAAGSFKEGVAGAGAWAGRASVDFGGTVSKTVTDVTRSVQETLSDPHAAGRVAGELAFMVITDGLGRATGIGGEIAGTSRGARKSLTPDFSDLRRVGTSGPELLGQSSGSKQLYNRIYDRLVAGRSEYIGDILNYAASKGITVHWVDDAVGAAMGNYAVPDLKAIFLKRSLPRRSAAWEELGHVLQRHTAFLQGEMASVSSELVAKNLPGAGVAAREITMKRWILENRSLTRIGLLDNLRLRFQISHLRHHGYDPNIGY
jgi:RHS repeat-associated protein